MNLAELLIKLRDRSSKVAIDVEEDSIYLKLATDSISVRAKVGEIHWDPSVETVEGIKTLIRIAASAGVDLEALRRILRKQQ